MHVANDSCFVFFIKKRKISQNYDFGFFMGKARYQGFTLQELLVGLAVVMLIMLWGVPAFTSTIKTVAWKNRTAMLVSSLQYARHEAVRSGKAVLVCPLNAKKNSEIQGCQPIRTQPYLLWDEGVLVFADDLYVGNRRYDSGERLHHRLFERSSVKVESQARHVVFLPTGQLADGDMAEFIVSAEGIKPVARIRVTASGRPEVSYS